MSAPVNDATTASAFAAYEAVRHRLPQARPPRGAAQRVDSLDDIADLYDVFLLDAFGVLNIGDTAIPGVADRIAALRAHGKRFLIVSNAAGFPHATLEAKYARLGYSFAPEDIITSRGALLAAMGKAPNVHWGLMATRSAGLGDLEGLRLTYLEEDPAIYRDVDAFLMIGSAAWTEQRQALLEAALQDHPRPIWVGNPDMVAPRETGFSIEPGHFAHRLADRTGITPQFFGKPFANIFDLAFQRLDPQISRARIVMVGDSLHTDILGAQAAGVASALIADYGFFAGYDIADAIKRAGIAPDHILSRP
jgi:HAD superfamily hydrolase (TIGR01450 family)